MSTRAVILAAGKGTRMKSRRPKVLHELCGRTMFEHVLHAVRAAGVKDVVAVVSPDLREAIGRLGVRTVVQEPQRGTGHAAQLAMAELPGDEAVLVLSGDMPLLPAKLLRAVIDLREQTAAAITMLTADVPGPTRFGRIVREAGHPARIVEHTDATPQERLITEVNAGVYCFDASALRGYLTQLNASNAQGELYLTDCIELAVGSGALVDAVVGRNHRDVMGVNTRAELAAARAVMQRRILRAHMLAGVSVVDPATTYVDVDVELAPDVTLLPQTHVLGRSRVARDACIGPNTSLIDARVGESATVTYSVVRDSSIGAGANVGPFAHVRGDSTIEEGTRVGNFVELKKTRLGRGAKASHLAYVGDTDVGEAANIGAGTITANYDGKRKHKTKIGARASIGSNSSLVAPVEIGEGALTGAGSVVTHDVPAGQRVAGNPARPLPKKERSPQP
jgi:bifunctional UDP-N-acetylglucosamine pyrophosphorylase / glucosamine-1-phosphate N-acetyltransferase